MAKSQLARSSPIKRCLIVSFAAAGAGVGLVAASEVAGSTTLYMHGSSKAANMVRVENIRLFVMLLGWY